MAVVYAKDLQLLQDLTLHIQTKNMPWRQLHNGTWQPAFSNILAYLTVFSISGKTRILQVMGTESFSFAILTEEHRITQLNSKSISGHYHICTTQHLYQLTHLLKQLPLILKKNSIVTYNTESSLFI